MKTAVARLCLLWSPVTCVPSENGWARTHTLFRNKIVKVTEIVKYTRIWIKYGKLSENDIKFVPGRLLYQQFHGLRTSHPQGLRLFLQSKARWDHLLCFFIQLIWHDQDGCLCKIVAGVTGHDEGLVAKLRTFVLE